MSSGARVRDAVAWNWSRLGDPAALSQATALGYLPFGVAGPLLIDRARLGGGLAAWLLVAAAGQLALMTVLWLSNNVARPRLRENLRPGSAVLTILIAVLVRAVIIAWLPFVLGLSPTVEIGYRIGAALLPQAGFLVIIALLVGTYFFHRNLAYELQIREAALETKGSAARNDLTSLHREMAEEVRRTIEPLLADLNGALDGVSSGTDSDSVRESIKQLVDDELRPLSHRLAEGVVERAPRPVDSAPPQVPVPMPSHIALRDVLAPLGIASVMLLLALVQAVRALPMPMMLVFPFSYVALAWLILAVCRSSLGHWSPPRYLGIGVVGVLSAAAMGASLKLIEFVGIPVPDSVLSSAIVAGMLIGSALAAYRAVNLRRGITEENLREAIERLRLELSRERQQIYVVRQRLSVVVHGSIQSALHAAAMRLAATTHPDAETVYAIKRDITNAMSQLDEPVSGDLLLTDILTDIAELWAGTCSVRWSLDHRTLRSLVESPAAANSVAEIVRECVSNAIRHGRADEVTITIAASGDRVVVTTVDNGSASTEWTPGLGSRMLDEICVTWRSEPAYPGTRIVAEVATQRALAWR